ncbi:MAG TPA: protein kinase [Candidatus Competibacter sp.]|nr:protein kinase [Candidatus Competibacter sp.]
MIDAANPAMPSTSSGTRRTNALASGCLLDEYRIDTILGAGGFGVTYKAWDTHLETWVAIKEYFPVEWSFRDSDGVTVHPNTQGGGIGGNDGRTSDYLWGLERFLDEARVLARLQHPFVVRVKRYFRGHGTAYIVMDYEEGEPLNAVLQDGDTLNEDELRGLLEDVLPALQAVHEQGFLHRDIKPSNLYVRASDHRVILIDFGAAREAVGRHSKSVTSLVTPGYSPPEQYTTRNDRYGPWTDIYALGAVLYRCVTGHPPIEAAERLLEDTLVPTKRICAGRYAAHLLSVIDRALAVRPEQRFASVAEMRAALDDVTDEEEGDETVILGPPLRPSDGPRREAETSHSIKTTPTPMPARESVVIGDDLEILPPLDERQLPTGRELEVLQSPPESDTVRREFSWFSLIGGGLVVGILAAVALIWLWPAAPDPRLPPSANWRQPPPSGSMTDANPSMATTPPAAVAPSPPVPSSSASSSLSSEPTAGPPLSAAPPLVSAPTSAISGSTTEPSAGAAQPAPVPSATPAPPSDSPAESLDVTKETDGSSNSPAHSVETTDAASKPTPVSTDRIESATPADTPGLANSAKPVVRENGGSAEPGGVSMSPKPQTPSVVNSAATTSIPTRAATRSASSSAPPSRTARRQALRKHEKRDTVRKSEFRPEPPVMEKSVPRATVSNPWESPAANGFNQK